MYEMVKKIIGRSCGGSGSPALLPAGLSSHCCVLLPSSCCPGPLQGMGEEFGALPLRWHLPRAGQPDPSSEQVSWLWVLRRAGSSRVGFSTAPECLPGAALHHQAGAFGLGKAWTQLRLCLHWMQMSVPAVGLELGAVPQVCCHWCSATGVLSLVLSSSTWLWFAWTWSILCFICWVSGAVPFPSHPTWLSRPELNNSHELNRIFGLFCSDCVPEKGPV